MMLHSGRDVKTRTSFLAYAPVGVTGFLALKVLPKVDLDQVPLGLYEPIGLLDVRGVLVVRGRIGAQWITAFLCPLTLPFAPGLGLEPRTYRLTAGRSTD
jgi:hypothetical protein